MAIPLRITYRDIDPSDAIEAKIKVFEGLRKMFRTLSVDIFTT